MWAANGRFERGNVWHGEAKNIAVMSNDLSQIEFSFEEKPERREPAMNSYNKMEYTQIQDAIQRTITPDIIARIQALDNEHALASLTARTGKESKEKAGHIGAEGIDLQVPGTARTNDFMVETERYVFRTVEITRISASPLGFFIRQGDGLYKKHGIFISRVSQGSFVDTNGLLKVGDEILQVNDVDVVGFSLDDVVRLIQIPKRLVLTVKTNAFLCKRSLSVGDAFSFATTNGKSQEKRSPKTAKIKAKNPTRADNYKDIDPGNQNKQTSQTETQNFNFDNNANELGNNTARSSVRSLDSSTIEDLIEAIRAQNNRSKHERTGRNLEQGKSFPPDRVLSSAKSELDSNHSIAAHTIKSNGTTSENAARKPLVLPKKPPPVANRKSSTLTPATTVNLVFDDSEEVTLVPPTPEIVSHESQRKTTDSDETLKVHTVSTSPRSPPGSPGGSPKARRRLPEVPTTRGDNLSSSPGAKALLNLPGEGRSRRLLPTPPPSPVAPHKALAENGKTSASPLSHENQEKKANRNSWSGPFERDDKSTDLSPSRKESGLSLSQLFSAFAFRSHQEGSGASEKEKSAQENAVGSAQTERVTRNSESVAQHGDIFEQQRHSVLLHSYASGNLPSTPRKLITRSSQPNLKLLGVNEDVVKPKLSTMSYPGDVSDNIKASPRLNRRRASLASITEKTLANHVSSNDFVDSGRLRAEAEAGFVIFPDDYGGSNLRSSHAVSGMVSIHLIKATNLQFADRKLLEKKKKVYCAVEVDFERKAFTSSKRASKTLTWDEMFEVEIQHGREVCLSCFTSSHEFDKPVAKVSFNLAPFVRCGQDHKVVFRMQPQGAIHVEMEFIEMKTLLKRAPSHRESGVFGFQLNVTSRMENSSVPLIVRKCVEEIDKRGLTSLGLYRISGNARRKRELHAQFDEDSATVDLSEESYPDINVIAGILKDYLRELPEPLVTQSMSKTLIKAAQDHVQDQDLLSQKRLLSKLLVQLPEINRDTLVYLLDHFTRVLAHKDTNKMDAHNLSVCFGPVLLCPPANLTESKDLLDLKLHNRVVEFLFYLWTNVGKSNN